MRINREELVDKIPARLMAPSGNACRSTRPKITRCSRRHHPAGEYSVEKAKRALNAALVIRQPRCCLRVQTVPSRCGRWRHPCSGSAKACRYPAGNQAANLNDGYWSEVSGTNKPFWPSYWVARPGTRQDRISDPPNRRQSARTNTAAEASRICDATMFAWGAFLSGRPTPVYFRALAGCWNHSPAWDPKARDTQKPQEAHWFRAEASTISQHRMVASIEVRPARCNCKAAPFCSQAPILMLSTTTWMEHRSRNALSVLRHLGRGAECPTEHARSHSHQLTERPNNVQRVNRPVCCRQITRSKIAQCVHLNRDAIRSDTPAMYERCTNRAHRCMRA